MTKEETFILKQNSRRLYVQSTAILLHLKYLQ